MASEIGLNKMIPWNGSTGTGRDNRTIIDLNFEKIESYIKTSKVPYVGENGNWWVGAIDSGVKAQGAPGNDGQDGQDGTNIAYKVAFNVSQYNNVFNYADATTARNAVPSTLRGLGQIVTYKLASGKWVTESYQGADLTGWATAANWKGIGGVDNPVYSTKATDGVNIDWSSSEYNGTNWMNTSGSWVSGSTTQKYIYKLPISAGTYLIEANVNTLGSALQQTIFIHSTGGTLITKYEVHTFPYEIVVTENRLMTILISLYNSTTSTYERLISDVTITQNKTRATFTDGESSIDIEKLKSTIDKVDNWDTGHPLSGKSFSILADSISAYTGYIPTGNSGWYPKNNVTSVDQMWWKILADNTGATLGINDSWGGAAISNYNPVAGTDSPYVSDLRVNRLGTTDVIFVFGGTNDFGDRHTPMGDYSFGNIQDTLQFKQAVTYLFQKLTTTYPTSKLICLIPLVRSDKGIPAKDTGLFLFDYSEVLKFVASIYGVRVIDLNKCGINYGNTATYLYDGLHPNAAGQQLIADYIIKETSNI